MTETVAWMDHSNVNQHTDCIQELYDKLHGRQLFYYIETYGCQMNAHDSEKIAGLLSAAGFTHTQEKTEADLLLFNTCCVREHAEKRVFGNIGALKKNKDEHKELIIGVCGCMMQQKGVAQRLMSRFPYVNFTMGPDYLHELPAIVQSVMNGDRVMRVEETEGGVVEDVPIKRMEGISACVNVMYGCNNFCSYCIVPYVRGRERSRELSLIVKETGELVNSGYSEVMLLGQNVNSYGKDIQKHSFADLLKAVGQLDGLRRIRFMTSHPKDLSDELIETMASQKNVCDHLHLPVQSGSNRILERMNRRYTTEDYLKLVDKLKRSNPRLELTTDIIVGFPGETEEDFQDTLSLVKKVGFSAAFTFMYSPRTGTKAAEMEDQVPEEVKKERLLRLNALQEQNTKATNERYIGTVEEVLVEGTDQRQDGMLYGKLSCFKMVYFPGTSDKIGQYIQVRITGVIKNSLHGIAEDGKENL